MCSESIARDGDWLRDPPSFLIKFLQIKLSKLRIKPIPAELESLEHAGENTGLALSRPGRTRLQ